MFKKEENDLNVRNFKNNIKIECGENFDKKYLEVRGSLIKKFGPEPREADVLWGLSNYLLSEFIQQSDRHRMKMIYFYQSLFLYNDGKEYFRTLQEAHKCDLMDFTEQGFIKKVEIVTCKENSCPACQKLSGKIFTIEQALKEMPIPEINCSHDPNPKSQKGWCRCIYVSVID